MNTRMIKRQSLAIAVGFLLTLGFQNCTPVDFANFQSQASKGLGNTGNGGPYEGKLAIYNSFEVARPCLEMGANLKPLPNHQIFQTQTNFNLVRENCQDLKIPKTLASADVTWDQSGQMAYAGHRFAEQSALGEFDVVAGSCPVGRLPK